MDTDRHRSERVAQLLRAARRAAVPAPRLRQIVAAAVQAGGGASAVAMNEARAIPSAPDPTDAIVARRSSELGAAYAGAMAPFREAILASNSAEDAVARVQALYVDWRPERVARLVEDALQIAAASAASTLAPERGRR